MKPEAQRIAIAKACGWKFEGTPKTGITVIQPNGEKELGIAHSWTVALWHIPDYLSDLNAMHEAEETLTDHQRLKFWGALCSVTKAAEVGIEGGCFSFVGAHATAAQRAEACLRTIGKWEQP